MLEKSAGFHVLTEKCIISKFHQLFPGTLENTKYLGQVHVYIGIYNLKIKLQGSHSLFAPSTLSFDLLLLVCCLLQVGVFFFLVIIQPFS